jgi:RNA-directed DNA polymerase
MPARRKSDISIVAMNPSNNAGEAPAAETGEPREVPKGNGRPDARLRAQHRARLHDALAHVRTAAAQDKSLRFTTLWHHVYDIDRLRETFYHLRKDGAVGVDAVHWRDYEVTLEANLLNLSSRLRRGAYHAKPVRRVYIPKADGRQRPIGIPALEDKLVQRATAEVLQAIYETEFLDSSYGFRPGRHQHLALDALAVAIEHGKGSWVLDADLRAFFDTIDHAWLLRMLEQRIADTRVLRHIKKWLAAGVLEDGEVHRSEHGSPQGGSISPLLANIYLHYAFDLGAECWRRQHARGEVSIVRFADDVVVCFQYREDAERFHARMQERLANFPLELHGEKTRLLEFGRYAVQNRQHRGIGKPGTFTFLGFTYICGHNRHGGFIVLRKSARKKVTAKVKEIARTLRRRITEPVEVIGQWLQQVVRGHYQYYAVPRNHAALSWFRDQVTYVWKKTLSRRSQKGYVKWETMHVLANQWLPRPRILHPYPGSR